MISVPDAQHSHDSRRTTHNSQLFFTNQRMRSWEQRKTDAFVHALSGRRSLSVHALSGRRLLSDCAYVDDEAFSMFTKLFADTHLTKPEKIHNFEFFLRCVEKSQLPCPVRLVNAHNQCIKIYGLYEHAETFKSILLLLMKHPRAGKTFFESLVEVQLVLDDCREELIEVLFGYEFFEQLQYAAIRHHNDKYLKRLIHRSQHVLQRIFCCRKLDCHANSHRKKWR